MNALYAVLDSMEQKPHVLRLTEQTRMLAMSTLKGTTWQHGLVPILVDRAQWAAILQYVVLIRSQSARFAQLVNT